MPSHNPAEAIKSYKPGEIPILEGMSNIDLIKWGYAAIHEWGYKPERRMRKKEARAMTIPEPEKRGSEDLCVTVETLIAIVGMYYQMIDEFINKLQEHRNM